MKVPFSQLPGRHERHFRRKLNNPLFPRPIENPTDDDLLEVQRLDHEELLAFIQQLRAAVQKAVELPPTAETQQVLDLKAELEQLYEQACRMADDQSANKAAIAELIEVIMRVIRAQAEGDDLAANELAQEAQARKTHFALLEYGLVADLLDPDSLIGEDELAPVLLSAADAEFDSALGLFDADQLVLLHRQADDLAQRDASLARRVAVIAAALDGQAGG